MMCICMTNNIRLRILVQQITQFLHVAKVTLWTMIAVTRMAQGFDIVDHFYNESDLCSLATLSREHSGLLILC